MELSHDRNRLALGQGAFYLAAGLWPVVHYRSFERVTGPKTDDWLVKTVGLLIASSGGVLLRAGLRKRVTADVVALGAGHAWALGCASGYYCARGRISKVYGLDALTEYALVALWALAHQNHRRRPQLPESERNRTLFLETA